MSIGPESPFYQPSQAPHEGYLQAQANQRAKRERQATATARDSVARRVESFHLLLRAIPLLSEHVIPSVVEVESLHSDSRRRRFLGKFAHTEVEILRTTGWSLGRADTFGVGWHPSDSVEARKQFVTVSTNEGRNFFGHARLVHGNTAYNLLVPRPSDAELTEANAVRFAPVIPVYDANRLLPIDKPDQISQAVGRLLMSVDQEPEAHGFQTPTNF